MKIISLLLIYEKKFIQELENRNENNDNISYYNNKKYYYKPSSPNSSYSKNIKKNNAYSSPELQKYNDINSGKLIEDKDENEEYILIKQPSRQNNRYGGNRNQYRKNYYKKNYKLKFTLEKYKIKYNIKEKQITQSSPINNNNESSLNEFLGDSDINDKSKIINGDNSINTNFQTISGYNTNESLSQNNLQEEIESKKTIFKNYKKSRFSFVNNDLDNDEQKQNYIVPGFINDVLNKKFYSLYFSNYIIKNEDESSDNNFLEKILLDEEIKTVNTWSNTN